MIVMATVVPFLVMLVGLFLWCCTDPAKRG
jgi:hypothetical protein